MLFKRKTTWVLVADGARARIFEKGRSSLNNATGQDYCSENLKTQDMITDRPGRTADSGKAMHQVYAPRTDWHEFQKQLFVKELCGVLGKSSNAFDELVIVSPPKTLGELRSNLCKQAKEKVKAEIPKDITKLSEHDLVAYLNREL